MPEISGSMILVLRDSRRTLQESRCVGNETLQVTYF